MPVSRLLQGAALGVCLLFGAGAAEAQTLVDLNFNTANQFSNNFRRVNPTGTTRSTASQVGSAVRHDNLEGTSFEANAVYIYDQTPGVATDANVFSVATPLSISLDFRATAANSSIGIYFTDPGNATNSILLLFNVDASGATDTFRVFRDSPDQTKANPGTVVTAATQNFSTSVATAGASGFVPITFTLSVAGTTPSLSMTVNGQTLSHTLGSTDFGFLGGNTTVSFRISDANISAATPVDFDNFKISTVAVPEPSAALSLFAGLALFAGIRRRR